jgi:hypothetical protein
MSRYLVAIGFLFAAVLTGCPSLPDLSENVAGEAPELKTLINKAEATEYFNFSDDGKTYTTGTWYSGVKLFRTESNTLLEHHFPEKVIDPSLPTNAMNTTPTADIKGVGFSGSNTWFFCVSFRTDKPGNENRRYSFIVRSINPPREIASFERCGEHFMSNGSHVMHNWELYNWQTGKSYPYEIFPPAAINRSLAPVSAAVMLTPGNLVLSWQYGKKGVMINDPIRDKTEIWDVDIFWKHKMAVTADDKYLINVAGRRCTLWKWPERQKVGHCSPWLYGKSLESFDMALAPDGKTFAFAADNAVRVYRTEPFQLLFETAVPSGVGRVAVSSDGYLAVAENRGILAVWDIAERKIVGRNRFVEEGKEKGFSPLLAFQPNGNRLAVGWGGLMFLELPARHE